MTLILYITGNITTHLEVDSSTVNAVLQPTIQHAPLSSLMADPVEHTLDEEVLGQAQDFLQKSPGQNALALYHRGTETTHYHF